MAAPTHPIEATCSCPSERYVYQSVDGWHHMDGWPCPTLSPDLIDLIGGAVEAEIAAGERP